MRQVLIYNGTVYISDSNNTPSAIVERDSTGAISANQVNATVLNPSNATYLPRSATLTATSTLDALSTVKRCDCTTASQIQTLPPAATVAGLQLKIKRLDSTGNTLTLKGNGTEVIDGSNTQAIAALGHMTVVSNGTGWDIL
ncbi:MAG TPA: hypothetical protein VFC78_22070 [Tepidisphaeraceae bacterium]|nr:hypothetical protein [Tepidisphaeraceae bacterium]